MLDLAADSAIIVSDFGQAVRFRAKPTDTPRSITAPVNRQPVDDDRVSPYAGHRPPTIHVLARNHATLGVLASEITDDVSELEIAYPAGTPARWRPILRILRHNDGCVLMEVKS